MTLLRATAALILGVALASSAASPAFADTIAAAQARANQVQNQVTALQTKAEIASEQYNAARSRHASLTVQVRQSEHTIAKLDAQRSALQGTLDARAASLYRQGPLGFLTVLLEARSWSDFDATYQMITNVNRRDALTVAQLKATKAQAAVVHTRLVGQESQAATEQRAMGSNEAQVKSHLAASKQVLAQADTTVKTLIAEQQAQEAAAAAAEAQRILAAQRAAESRRAERQRTGPGHQPASGGKHHGSPQPSSSAAGDPPAGGKGAKAVYWAETRLGDPYVWAAAGPHEFDCSGLTMWAYKKVGVSLPHYSREQIGCGKRVSKSNLQPGDLVFFGSPIHHVGMYVGGGDFIEAPYSGANVRISRLSHRDDFAGACRP